MAGAAPHRAVFCPPEHYQTHPGGCPQVSRGWGAGGGFAVVKAKVGTNGKAMCFCHYTHPGHPRLSPPVLTGRMKAVSGGSWLEYLSIHCSSSVMVPSSKAVCSEEPSDRKATPVSSHQSTRETPHPSAWASCQEFPSALRRTSFPRQGMRCLPCQGVLGPGHPAGYTQGRPPPQGPRTP